jgi:hypothetical protein
VTTLAVLSQKVRATRPPTLCDQTRIACGISVDDVAWQSKIGNLRCFSCMHFQPMIRFDSILAATAIEFRQSKASSALLPEGHTRSMTAQVLKGTNALHAVPSEIPALRQKTKSQVQYTIARCLAGILLHHSFLLSDIHMCLSLSLVPKHQGEISATFRSACYHVQAAVERKKGITVLTRHDIPKTRRRSLPVVHFSAG